MRVVLALHRRLTSPGPEACFHVLRAMLLAKTKDKDPISGLVVGP